MTSDVDYLKNYETDTVYSHATTQGSYVTVVAENEVLIGEVAVTERSRIAVKAFYVNGKRDYSTFSITKLKFHKTYGWQEDGILKVNRFDMSNMEKFVSLIASLDLSEGSRRKVKLGNVKIEQLHTLLNSSEGPNLVQQLSNSPNLKNDIYAVAAKRLVLAEFKEKLDVQTNESEWQAFF